MIRSISKLAPCGALALFALAGCNSRQKGNEPATYPTTTPEATAGAEEAPPPIQYPPGQEAGQPGAAGTAQGSQQWGQPGAPGGQWSQGQQGGQQGQQGAVGERQTPPITVIGIEVDTKLAQMCNLPGTNVFFEFDSTRLDQGSKDRLQQIATCVTSGRAKGKNLMVVGYTDPQGADDYNKQLGMSRAEAVERYLRTLGVKSSRVELMSKGEASAAREPMAWPIERRVTIQLQHP